MQKRDDEALVAYLDGELEPAERRQVEAWLDADPAARDRLTALAEATNLVRGAYDEIANEPVPEHLIAAARGQSAEAPAAEAKLHEGTLVVLRPLRNRSVLRAIGGGWGLAAAAGLFGLVIGGAGGFYGGNLVLPSNSAAEQKVAAATLNNSWLDNAATFYKLSVSAGDTMLVDVPASNDSPEALQKISQSLPQQVRLPDLKPWGLIFRGARLVAVEGKPAAQLVYTTDNKAIGPLTLLIGSSKQPDVAPTFDQRQGVNQLYWRHHGRAYVLVGQADVGYLWGIANDVAWQLDAI
jgi:anti-sigma factor RsiW